MPRRIQEDHEHFRNVVSGTTGKELKKWMSTGRIFRARGKDGKISIPIPRIDLPHFIFGKPEDGVGAGPGDEGDIIDKEPAPSKGPMAGEDPGEAIFVNVDMEMILEALQLELQLPNMLPKATKTYDEVKVKYNSISKVGPRALLHKRKTLLQTLKRMSSEGLMDESNARILPGESVPTIPFMPIKDDERFRQWNEIKLPSSNAVIFFARDISGSMDDFKCEIVSDLSWWLDIYIRRFYKKTERLYVVHDTHAKEVDEKSFYNLRNGGGTACSSALKWINKQLKFRYPPEKWNIYVFYFTDGDNMTSDNPEFIKVIKKDFGNKVNLVGITQIMAYGQGLKQYVDAQIVEGKLNNKFVRTTEIAKEKKEQNSYGWYMMYADMPEEERNAAIKNALKDLLGTHNQFSQDKQAAGAGV